MMQVPQRVSVHKDCIALVCRIDSELDDSSLKTKTVVTLSNDVQKKHEVETKRIHMTRFWPTSTGKQVTELFFTLYRKIRNEVFVFQTNCKTVF